MSAQHTMPKAPDLPFDLEPGHTPARSAVELARARGWLLLPVAVLPIGAAAVNDGARGAAVAAVAVLGMILAVALTVLVGVRIVSGHRITVTHAELIIKRLRRRTLSRADAGELVLGFFTVRALDPAGRQACFTTRDGKRFATVTVMAWPPGGLRDAAAALGVAVREQDHDRDRRLQPMWIRHPVLFRLGVMIATTVTTVGIVLTLMRLG